MTNNEKIKRINFAIKETNELLTKAIVSFENSLKVLEIEKAENLELGNDDSCNDHAYKYVKEREEKVNWLKNHIKYLENMLISIG